MIEETRNLECIVFGKVQGVGFRAWVRKKALKKNISGWVKNKKDGTVEVKASGIVNDLKFFLSEIEKGSFFSKVEKVEYKFLKFKKLDDFKIVIN